MESLRGRLGLVLQGGGAKGAFTFGALLALSDHGLKFDAVSGTSAGALNACLCASSDPNAALIRGWNIWTELRFSDVIIATPKRRALIVCTLPIIWLKWYMHGILSLNSLWLKSGCMVVENAGA
ncbi:MAG: patatin-like phospholipase family protein [Acidobacteriaceae bacterium]